jgi:poly(hydroxyalkanoate) depolymerase family esterase
MNERMHSGLREATRLTRAGQLVEATAVIQRMLQGGPASSHVGNPPVQHTGEVIEGTFRVSEPAPHSTTVSTLPSPHSALVPPELRERAAPPMPPQPFPRPDTLRPAWPDQHPPASPTSVVVPDHTPDTTGTGGQFISGSYTNQAGTRTYKLYIPTGYHRQALPLVVMLHGCTQSPDDFAAGTRMNAFADEQLFFVVYPAQASAANASKCWNWFKTADQQRDQGEPALIAGITRQIASSYAVDAQRIAVAGLSSGGAMAAIMAMTYPELYAACGIHSGLAYGAAHDMPSAFAAMQGGGAIVARMCNDRTVGPGTRVVPLIVFHGDRDTTVKVRNADQVIAQWAQLYTSETPDAASGPQLKATVQRGQAPAGRAYTRAIYHDARGEALIEQWLVEGAGHAWAGGSPAGTFTDPQGPDATREMVRFFNTHHLPKA